MSTPQQARLAELAAQALAAHGLKLVVARLTGGSGRLTLQVLAEKPDGTSPTLDDCTAASRTLSAQLDVEDIISSRYVLEVSSPGWDRPLLSVADCTRFTGRHATFRFTHPRTVGTVQLGTVHGVILGTEDEKIHLKTDDAAETTFPFTAVHTAHLSPTEEETAVLMKQPKSLNS